MHDSYFHFRRSVCVLCCSFLQGARNLPFCDVCGCAQVTEPYLKAVGDLEAQGLRVWAKAVCQE